METDNRAWPLRVIAAIWRGLDRLRRPFESFGEGRRMLPELLTEMLARPVQRGGHFARDPRGAPGE